ncbi:MAG: YhjD/YihY/BrkB family envelope integrity protein [Myxococcota bacterium]|nr:YhjD/YihY/BrkB family envelope integrity protein [Myxococcota bacterium]
MATSPVEIFQRSRRFLLEDLWRADFGARRLTAALIRGVQLSALIVRGFVDDKLLLRASALTYITSLAIIPILVVLLSVIKWLGLSRDLVVLGVNRFLAGSPESVERIMAFVDSTNVGALGSVGGGIFLVTTVLSLRHVEETFDDIWGALKSRSWVRRFTNYLAVVVVAPLVLGSLVSLSSSVGAAEIAQRLNMDPLVDVAKGVILGIGPSLSLLVAFSATYLLLPNTRVRVLSALLGGTVAAVLFIAAQYVYVSFSVGVARYDALFGGFAFVPLLLVWIYLSWSIVLLGAEIAYAHQNLARYRREARDREMEPAEREAVGMRVIVEIARAFRDRQRPKSAEALSDRLGSSLRIVTELLVRFEKAGLVVMCGTGDGKAAFQLGRPAEDLPVGEILAVVRGTRSETPAAIAGDAAVLDTIRTVETVLRDAEAAVGPVQEQSLADLLHALPAQPGGSEVSPGVRRSLR